MRRAYHHWFSSALGREMALLTFGHAGVPMIVFPTSLGAFFEYEDRGMVAAIADKIDAGLVRLVTVSTVDAESFYAGGAHPRARLERYLQYERYLVTDVLGFVRQTTGYGTAGVTGCSFGAYHAFTMALRHPDVFTTCITMGGAFDITRFLDGYYDEDAYLLCPPHFLPSLADPSLLDRLRRNKWVLVTGEHDICRADTEQAGRLLAAKNVPYSLHVWGYGSNHDWPEWIKMAAAYIP
jgi:esterase/lipase superfamily enzyme